MRGVMVTMAYLQAYVGLVFKYGNAVRGWRKRLLVLHKGILRDYKVSSILLWPVVELVAAHSAVQGSFNKCAF